MAYYFFDKCERECLPELEKIAREIGLTEKECVWKNSRFWSGNVLINQEKFYRELLMSYSSDSPTPLMVQTNLDNSHPEEVKKMIRRLIKLTRPGKIYREPLKQLQYDLQEFEN